MSMEAISKRRSIRKFKQIELTRNQMDEIIQAGIDAPSGKNKQPWRFIVVRGQKKQELVAALERGIENEKAGTGIMSKSKLGLPDAKNTAHIMKEAPVIVLVFDTEFVSPYEELESESHVTELVNTLSIGAAVENMLLEASDMGIGSLWICNTFYGYRELCEWAGRKEQLLAAVAFGYADERPEKRSRKQLNEITKYIGF